MKLLKYIFPENYSCYICDRDIFDSKYLICEQCLKNLPFNNGRVCLHCGDVLVSDGDYCKRCKGKKFIYDRAISTFLYKNEICKLIADLKYNNKKYISKCFGKFMSESFLKNKLYADVIIPVPLCEKRFKLRGYNQSELLANEISKIIKVKVNTNCLKRVKETPTQTKLDFLSRQENIKDAFKVYKSKYLKDKTVLLVDDVYTTGATITECSKILKNSGVKTIYVLTCAHTVLKIKKE